VCCIHACYSKNNAEALNSDIINQCCFVMLEFTTLVVSFVLASNKLITPYFDYYEVGYRSSEVTRMERTNILKQQNYRIYGRL